MLADRVSTTSGSHRNRIGMICSFFAFLRSVVDVVDPQAWLSLTRSRTNVAPADPLKERLKT